MRDRHCRGGEGSPSTYPVDAERTIGFHEELGRMVLIKRRIDNDIISTAYKVELETGVIFDPHYRSVDFPPPREPLDDSIEKEGVAV